ncbi:unnamed protein product, partial [Candidula unifasciata]
NFKHHRLKSTLERLAARERLYSSQDSWGRARGSDRDMGRGQGDRRRRRSVGVSRKHTVETLVVADAKMYKFHGEDVQQYVLTLMSV